MDSLQVKTEENKGASYVKTFFKPFEASLEPAAVPHSPANFLFLPGQI